jgi:2-dehydropantoate 2-reductase
LGAVLVHTGSSVVFLAKPSTGRVLQATGLRLESATLGPLEVSVSSRETLESPVDACLVTVKAPQLSAALSRMPADTLGDGLLIPFLNGIDHVEMLRARYPRANVVPATIRVESSSPNPGVIRHTSPFAAIEMAPSTTRMSRVGDLADQLRTAGFSVRMREEESAMLWEKLAFLAPLALLTTYWRTNAGTIRTTYRSEVLAVVSVIVNVAGVDGVFLDAERVVALLDAVPGGMQSSMSRDQAAGRELELEAIGGSVVRRSKAAGVDTPVTKRVVDSLLSRSNATLG